MTYQFQNVSVLVVDDMRPMVSLIVSVLKIFGFKQIHTSNNTEDAFIKFCQHNHDIIITDWQMELFEDIELIDRIRTHPESPNQFVPIILLSAYTAETRVLVARDKGITEFLVKPFTAKDLFARIEQLIEKQRPFIESGDFFGPDRRRRKENDYNGPRRRHVDASIPVDDARLQIEDIIKRLKSETPTRVIDKAHV